MKVLLKNAFTGEVQETMTEMLLNLCNLKEEDVMGQVVWSKDIYGLIPSVVIPWVEGFESEKYGELQDCVPEWVESKCWARFLVQFHPDQTGGVLIDLRVRYHELVYAGKCMIGVAEVQVTLVGIARTHKELLAFFGRKNTKGGYQQVASTVESGIEWHNMDWSVLSNLKRVPLSFEKKLRIHWYSMELSKADSDDDEVEHGIDAFDLITPDELLSGLSTSDGGEWDVESWALDPVSTKPELLDAVADLHEGAVRAASNAAEMEKAASKILTESRRVEKYLRKLVAHKDVVSEAILKMEMEERSSGAIVP